MSTVVVLGSKDASLVNFRGPMIRAMLERGHTVIASAPDISTEVRDTLTGWGARCQELPISRTGLNPAHDVQSVLAMVKFFRQIAPDILLAYTIKPVVYGTIAAKIAGVSRTYSMITGLGYAFIGEGIKAKVVNLLAQSLYKLSLRLNDGTFFQNRDDCDLFKELGILSASTPTTVINGSGVDLAHYARQNLPQKTSFLMIARLLKDKGISEYLDAACALKKHYPEVEFHLVGTLDDNPSSLTKDELQAVLDAGSIEYWGHLDDVRPAIKACSVYVLPSYREGMPRTVLEAMAMGRAVITTDTPGCRETVIEGVNGYLVPVRDTKALIETMEECILNPEILPEMGEASYHLAQEKFDVHKVNEIILKAMSLA